MQPSRDHQVKNQPQVAIAAQAECDALTDSSEFAYGAAFGAFERRLDGAQEEGAGQADFFQRLTDDAGLKGSEVGGDVG